MAHQYIERVVDLIDPAVNRLDHLSIEEARRRILRGTPEEVRAIRGSFALLAQEGKMVRLARSLDRPMRYFLAKRVAGPVLIVADRIDTIANWLDHEGLGGQFQPAYTRMVPAHHVVELQLIGCPDPDPTYTRFFSPTRNAQPADLDKIGEAYVGALANEVSSWLGSIPGAAPIGVCFSGGIDSGAVFCVTYHLMRRAGINLSRLKAFTLNLGAGRDIEQARTFLSALHASMFLEEIEVDAQTLDPAEAVRVIEDYKPLDVQCAAMGLALCRGIRARYPEWRYLIDGDGGDENLKDYPIEENPELTIHSVVNNTMLYQEGWGVGKIKHSLTYSGGLSRSYCRTYAPGRKFGFDGFSPFTRPDVIAVAESIPFVELTEYDVPRLYGLKGAIVARGVRAITGIEMPVFPKRRFQHGTMPQDRLAGRLPPDEAEYRRHFAAIYG